MPTSCRRTSAALVVSATVAACVVAAAIPATPALGDDGRRPHQPTTVHITGLLTLTNADTGEYTASGDLEGTWTIPPARAVNYYATDTTIIQKGTENFAGCLVRGARRCGTLNSDYISWTYLEPGGRLISGGCVHAPTGGTRGFRGVRGLVVMTDTPVGDQVNTLYQGELILGAQREPSMPVPAAGPGTTATSARSAAAASGSC